MSSTPPLHVLRGILRSLKAGKESSNTTSSVDATRKYIMGRYRSSAAISPDEAKPLRQLAYDFYNLQKDIAERSRLHKIDTGAENQLSPMEMSRRAAARAGLQLPDLNPNI